MVNNGNKTNCGFADEIVSYIYDEIGAAERAKFETHLENCGVCTDEFAAISNARFSVFEWQKEEFVHLATPEIVIPYVPTKAIVEETVPAGILTGIRGWLSLVNLPVTVAAGLAISVGLALLAFTYLGKSEQQLAADVNVPAVVTLEERSNIGAVDIIMPASPTTGGKVNTPSKDMIRGNEIRSVRAVENRRIRSERQMEAARLPLLDPALKLRKAPKLSGYDENDDRSLRLTDLFDEDGG